MTFSPFYMGNHVRPLDENMNSQGYTISENWGGQINFMVPLDGSIVERCKAMADRQQDKMRLDYELVRALKCAELQQKGFIIRPESRVAHMCNDIIPIVQYQKEQNKYQELANQNNPLFIMSTLSDQREAREKAAKEAAESKKTSNDTTKSK